jgi:hypothetical protein
MAFNCTSVTNQENAIDDGHRSHSYRATLQNDEFTVKIDSANQQRYEVGAQYEICVYKVSA